MNAPYLHIWTDWKAIAMDLGGVIIELHPEYAAEVLAVISHHTKAVQGTINHAGHAPVDGA